jgi:hypothetical protein
MELEGRTGELLPGVIKNGGLERAYFIFRGGGEC